MAGRVVLEIILILQLLWLLEIAISIKIPHPTQAFKIELNYRILVQI